MKEWNYINSKAEGMQKSFYRNGQLLQEGSFKNNKLHGESKTFYEDGKIKFIDTYDNGTRIDRKEFDEMGNLIANQTNPKPNQTASPDGSQARRP